MNLETAKAAAGELSRLQWENELLRAKVEVLDILSAVMRAGAVCVPVPGSEVGTLLQIQIERQSAIEEMKAKEGEEMLCAFNEAEEIAGVKACPECGGLGHAPGRPELCFYCGGTGKESPEVSRVWGETQKKAARERGRR